MSLRIDPDYRAIAPFRPGSAEPAIPSAADPIGRLVKQRALRGASKSHPLYFDRLVIRVQTALIAIQQTRFHERGTSSCTRR
jgi:hypothetical protein